MVIDGRPTIAARCPADRQFQHAAQTAVPNVNATLGLFATMIELPNSIIDVDRFVTG